MALIKTSNSVPSVYTNKSRDFQVIGHLYEAAFNSSKLATDMVDTMMPGNNFDERLIDLSATTRGFTTKHQYSARDLSMILSSFAHLLRWKGSKKAIDEAINIMLRSQGISDDYIWLDYDPRNKEFNLGISTRLGDRALLFDLLDYILPFGFSYRITNYTAASDEAATRIVTEDTYSVGQPDDITSLRSDQAIVSKNYRTTQIDVPEPSELPASMNSRYISSGKIIEEGE